MLAPNNYRAEVVLDLLRDEIAELTSELTNWYEQQYPRSETEKAIGVGNVPHFVPVRPWG